MRIMTPSKGGLARASGPMVPGLEFFQEVKLRLREVHGAQVLFRLGK